MDLHELSPGGRWHQKLAITPRSHSLNPCPFARPRASKSSLACSMPSRLRWHSNGCNQRLATLGEPHCWILSRVRCIALLDAFSILLSTDLVLLHDVRTLLDDAGKVALVYLKLESVCLKQVVGSDLDLRADVSNPVRSFE